LDPVTLARLNASLRDLLVELLSRRVRDRRVQDVSVTGVEVSRDLSVARVYYSLLGTQTERRVAQRGLESVAGFLRREAGRRMRLRSIPELRFVFDESLERGARIDSLLRDIESERERTQSPETEEPEDE
jgi:ribosome-binding factor A